MEENSSDLSTQNIRKQLNSSERIKTKELIRKSLYSNFESVRDMRYFLEDEQIIQCHKNQSRGPHVYMEHMLSALGFGEFDLYKCNCVNYDAYSDFEILQIFRSQV